MKGVDFIDTKSIIVKAQSDFNELYSILINSNEYDKREVLLFLKNHIENCIKGGNLYLKYFMDEIEEELIEEGYCPECGEELKTKSTNEYLAEAWGRPIYEDYYIRYCPACNWSSKDYDERG